MGGMCINLYKCSYTPFVMAYVDALMPGNTVNPNDLHVPIDLIFGLPPLKPQQTQHSSNSNFFLKQIHHVTHYVRSQVDRYTHASTVQLTNKSNLDKPEGYAPPQSSLQAISQHSLSVIYIYMYKV